MTFFSQGVKTYIIYTNISLFCLFYALNGNAQIYLSNPSFEDTPADATVPSGWWKIDSRTTPDILPGFWGVYSDASDGDTFIGLITRPNGTWECIGQKLSESIRKGECYYMALDLAHSYTYAGYSDPVKLRIYASSKKKKKEQLIFESPIIEHEDWKFYEFEFNAEKNYKYILIEAYHDKTKSSGYEGNILLDNIQAISLCSKA